MNKTLLTLAVASLLSACGGGSAPSIFSGQLVDGPVANVRYQTSSGLSGITDGSGNFSYRAGDTVKFSIGKITLGEGRASALLTPLDLVAGATMLNDPNVVKILQLLQTLDDDLDPGNGIKIPDAVVARLTALPAEKHIKDLTDLSVDVIAPAFAGGAPTLKTALCRHAGCA
jgi:hypothetical protein